LIDADKKEFMLMMKIVCSSFNHREFDKETLRYWFSKLDRYDFKIVSNAFDQWIDNSRSFPTVKDIVELCKPKAEMYAKLPHKINLAESKKHSDEVKQAVSDMTKPKRDMKAWAKKIIANPKAYPDISLRIAKEALEIKDELATNSITA